MSFWTGRAEIGVSKSSFYRWRVRMESGRTGREQKPVWNQLRPEESQIVLEQALAQPHLSARELAWWLCDHANFSLSEATVRRILKSQGLLPRRAPQQDPAAKEWRHKTRRINQIWQSDATRFFIPGWGHYWLVSVIDDFSRRLLAWELVSDIQAESLVPVIQQAMEATGRICAPPVYRPAHAGRTHRRHACEALAQSLRLPRWGRVVGDHWSFASSRRPAAPAAQGPSTA